MSITKIEYRPNTSTTNKATNGLNKKALTSTVNQESSMVDKFKYSKTTQNNKVETAQLKEDLNKTKSQQGLIGKLWDGFKNLTHIGAGSLKAEQAINDFEKGTISEEEMQKSVLGYKDGQKQCVDMVSDIVSGIAAFGGFALATGIGIAASPFTGGASLGLVAAGFGIAGVAGAGAKIAIKGAESIIGGKKYDSFVYDLATGGINGIFAPITAGIGGAAGKAVAGKVGVTAIRESGEVIVKEALEGSAKGAITKTLLTTNIKYVGGTTAARALALGTDMAVNGAITGAVDSGTRYSVGNSENKSINGLTKEVAAGTIGGLIAAPVVGGGMRLIGNQVGKLTGKLQNKVSTNYYQAKSAMLNTPITENPDIEVIKGFGGIVKQTQDLVNDVQIKGYDLFKGLEKSSIDLNENALGIIKSISSINSEMSTLSQENKALIIELLKEASQGKDVSSKVSKLAQKGISLADTVDEKIGALCKELDEKLIKITNTNDNLTQKVSSGISLASQTLDNTGKIANDAIDKAKKIPETNAYKQLGDLPERTIALYKALKTEASSIDDIAKTAKEKILSGNLNEGLEDLMKYYNELDAFNIQLEQQISSMQSSAARSGIEESADILKDRLSKLVASEKFQSMPKEKQIQALMENSNILFSKFAQTFSSNENLPPDVAKIFKQFTSNGTVLRDITQAQNLADELYGAGKYKLIKSFGAGSIGETYLAQNKDGTEFVIKMLKEGVTKEKFAQDRAMFTKYINEFVKDTTEKEYKLNLINSMFDAWEKELDFSLEAQGAKNLAQGAKRFTVAQTLEVGSKNGQNISLVMEKANGVELGNLLEMVQLYKENKSEYFIKYAKQIKDNPALKTPEAWINDLGAVYQKAQNEQAMFIGKSGTRTIHADPHTGNVFVDFDAATAKPKIVYIDAGNVIERSNKETLQDIALSINMMFGNSQGIANAMLDGATLPNGADKAEIATKFAKLLDEKLYRANVNLRSTKYTQDTINSIMKELNIVPNSNNSNLMKATLQRIETSRAINRACGTSSSKSIDIKDLAAGILKSLKSHPKETWETISPIISWAYKNNDQAMLAFFQMIIKNAQVQTNIPA